MKKRDRLEIIKDMLEVVQNSRTNVKQTHIMYKANLSHQMLTEYLDELLKKDLLKEVEDKKGKKYFEMGKKGYDFLKDYKMIRGFVDSYGLD